MQSGECPGIAVRHKGKDIRENGRSRKGQQHPNATHDGQSALPCEIGRELWKHEQAGIAGVKGRVTAMKLKTEKRWCLDRHGGSYGKAQNDECFCTRRL